MTDKTEEKIAELEGKVSTLEDEVSTLEDALNRVNDDLDHALNIANKLEQLIALWNEKHPNDQIFTHRRRPMSDYTMTDQEWKEATRVPHPREWKKKFNPSTGEFQ